MTDEYATLRTAFHAGATIQAYTVEGDDGSIPLIFVDGCGYWRDLSCDGEPKFSCHPTRYRVKDLRPAEAPVAFQFNEELHAAMKVVSAQAKTLARVRDLADELEAREFDPKSHGPNQVALFCAESIRAALEG